MTLGLQPLGRVPLGLDSTPLPEVIGTLSVTAPVATLSATAAVAVVGTGTPTAPVATLSGAATATITGAGTPTAPVATLSGVASLTVTASGAITAPVATLIGLASNGGNVDTHDPDTWREYRKSLRNLAKIAEERRRAKVDEAREIRQEILAALGEAKPLDGTEIKSAVRAVASAVPGRDPEKVTEAQLSRVTDWAPIYEAVAELRRAIEYERMIEQDDEEVLLLI